MVRSWSLAHPHHHACLACAPSTRIEAQPAQASLPALHELVTQNKMPKDRLCLHPSDFTAEGEQRRLDERNRNCRAVWLVLSPKHTVGYRIVSAVFQKPPSLHPQTLYCFEREPECVRAELGRGARPGLASFQVFTRTLRPWMSVMRSFEYCCRKKVHQLSLRETHLCVLSAYSSAFISLTPTFSPPSFVKVMFFFSMCFCPRSASSLLHR